MNNLVKKIWAVALCITTAVSVVNLGALSAIAATPKKPKGAKYFNGHYYYIYNDASSWEEAKAKCKKRGGYLAIINNSKENEFLANYAMPTGYDVYFGITDSATEGVWRDVNGKPLKYTNWHQGEPNNEGFNEDYGHFYFSSFGDSTWNDAGGIDGYICEWNGYSVDVSDKKVYLTKGKKKQINYNIEGNTKYLSSKKAIWKSSNKKVAKVSSKGKIVAINAGSCTITCKVGDVKEYIKVVVKPKAISNFKVKSRDKREITLSWKKQAGVKKYSIYMYDRDVEEYVRVKTVGSFSKTTIYGLRKNKTYKFKIRGYVTSGGKKYYGEYSKTLKAKTKR